MSTATRTLSDAKAERYNLSQDINRLDKTTKGARTRQWTAQREVSYLESRLAGPLNEHGRRLNEYRLSKAKDVLDRRTASLAAYEAELREATDRQRAINEEIKALTEAEEAERQVKRVAMRRIANEFVVGVAAGMPLIAEHGLEVQVTGSRLSVGWEEPYTGHDGKTYSHERSVSVEYPHPTHSGGVSEPRVSYSMFMPDLSLADMRRYAAAITVAVDLAAAIAENGQIVDEAW